MNRRAFLSALGVGLLPTGYVRAQAETGMFERREPAGVTQPMQRVFFHRPAQWRAEGPVLVVMHGLRRDAERYRDQWMPLAEQHGVLLVCPEFSSAKFPGSRWYSLGGVGETADPERRAFAVPDRLFHEVRQRFGASAAGFGLYGHSAGAQFVHRCLLFAPAPAPVRAIAANAGWYTLPTFDQPFPYGLANTDVTREEVGRYLQRRLIVLLGEDDTDPEHRSLRRDAGADAQGVHRFARGMHFMAAARAAAARQDVTLGWHLATVPGSGHNNARMARAAVRLLSF